MARKGPPKFFENKPRGPTKVPLPSVRAGRAGKSRSSGDTDSTPRKKWITAPAKSSGGRSLFGGGENWKTYAVLGVSAVLLVVIIIGYVAKGYKELDQSRGVQELALLGATLQAIDAEPGGFRLAPEVRNDAALLAIARALVEGGKPNRNAAGDITGWTPPAKNAPRLFVPSIPDRSVTGSPFHFVFPTAEGEHLPSVVIDGVGTLHPPDPQGRWIFDGDLTRVPRQREVGGEMVPVRIKRPDGEVTVVEVFKPRAEQPPGS